MISLKDGLSFDDVLLVPKHANIKSRSEIDLSVKINNLIFNHPIVISNMKSLIGEEMLRSIILSNGLGLMHRFISLEDQFKILNNLHFEFENVYKYIGFSIGVQEDDRFNVEKIYSNGIYIFCIDVAHGDNDNCIDMTYWIKQNYPDTLIIAGNVATASGAINLWEAGADIVKVNVGAGSVCTTRIETGNGVPQLTALMDVHEVHKQTEEKLNRKLYIMADGGAKNTGDLVKSLCFSHMVMTGNLFAGAKETPEEYICIGDNLYKRYMGSSTHKKTHIEGVSAIVKAKGSYDEILSKILEGIRSGCSYQGASNLEELRKSPEFVKITNSGLIESKPHDVIMI